MTFVKTILMAIIVFITGCGGGGGAGTPTSSGGSGSTGGSSSGSAPTPIPDFTGSGEGFWSGSNTSGVNLGGVFLDNNDFFGVTTDKRGGLVSLTYGKSSGSGLQFKMSGYEYSLLKWGITYSTASGTLASKATLSLSTSNGTAISARYDPSYDTPASISQISGNYAASGISAGGTVGNIPLTVSASGAVAIDFQNGCKASGTVSPRSNNVRKVFNITLNFAGGTCVLGQTAATSGILYVDTNVTPAVTRILTLNASMTDVFVSEAKKF